MILVFEIIGALVVLGIGLTLVFIMFKGMLDFVLESDDLYISITYYNIWEWLITFVLIGVGSTCLYYGADYFIGNLTWGSNV